MTTNDTSLTQRELIIRLDERAKQMQKDIEFLKQTVIPSSEHGQLMTAMTNHEERIDSLEDFKTRIIAYLTIAGAVGGLVAGFVVDVVKTQVFK